MTPPAQPLRRVCFWALCISPLVIAPLTGARGMRIDGVQQVVGALLFVTVAVSAWWLSRPPRSAAQLSDARLRLVGMLLLVPFALIALLWVGLGTPWDATPSENEMRYAVLLTGAVALTAATFLLKDLLCETGERLFSTLGLALSVLSGSGFLVWTSFQLGFHAMVADQGQVQPATADVNNVLDALLFASGCLAYLMTAALACSLGKVRWLGPRTSLTYALLNIVALTLLMLRGVSFPTPAGDPAPWFTQPGFIVGIPAMPWIMPFLLGAILLRRSGGHHEQRQA